jgi:succinoglycan biosynthesis transport protein ExoP
MTDETNNGTQLPSPAIEARADLARGRAEMMRNQYPGIQPAVPAVMAPDGLLKMLWRSHWTVLLCMAASLGAGFAYVARCTPVFTSVSKLYVQQNAMAPTVETRTLPRYNLYTQAALIKSTAVLNAALADPSLGQMHTFTGSDSPLAYLQKSLQTMVGKDDDIITVSLDSPYPQEAAEIVNRVVKAYITDYDEHRQKTSAELLLSMSARLDEARAERDKRLTILTQFKKDNKSLVLESDRNTNPLQRYLSLETAYTNAQIQTIEAESRKQRIVALAEHPALLQPLIQPGTGTSGGPATERSLLDSKLFEKTLERSASEAVLTPNHQHVENIDAEIEQIKARIAALDKETLTVALTDAEEQRVETRQKELQIASLLEKERQEVVAHSSLLAEYVRLNEEYEQSKEYCQTLDERIRGINLSDSLATQEIRVLEAAQPPLRPSWPQRARILAAALVVGVLMGGAVALLRDLLDQTIRSADEIQRMLGLSVLGAIPSMPRLQRASWRGQKTRLQPDSHEAEAFRAVRTAIVFGTAKENARTILVTSPSAGDGKSMLVSNLAIAMAQAGHKTIVLDADFRKPTQHILLGSDPDRQGLMAALNGKSTLAQAVQSTEVPGLNLLSCGWSAPNPAEILGSPAFVQILRRLVQVYDRVIIDAPPVMAVTDAQVLGALCDVTVLVLRADKSRRHISQRAIDALRATGTHLLGAVVNDVGRKGERFGYYHGGYESYQAAARNGNRALQRRHTGVVATRHKGPLAPISKAETTK